MDMFEHVRNTIDKVMKIRQLLSPRKMKDCIRKRLVLVDLDILTFLMVQNVKSLPAMQETWVQFLGWKDPLEKEIATHSSILAWRIPWTEEPGGLQSMGLQRIGDDLATKQQTTKNYICNNPISKQDHILRYWG